MVALRFDYRDLFRAPRIALSLQRLWIQALGLAAGYAGYVVLTYAALMLAGEPFGSLWSSFGLFPSAIGIPMPWTSWIVYVLGIVVLAVAWLVTATAVARATYMHLKGNHFYTWKDAFRFGLKKKGGAVVATPLFIAGIALAILFGGLVVGWLAKVIPFVGELGLSAFTLFWYAASLFLVFLALALGVSLALTPSILATTDDDAFEGIFQSFSTLVGQPWRFIVYVVLTKALALAGFVVLAFFAKQAWVVMNRVLMLWGGDKVADLSAAASYFFQNLAYPAQWARLLPENAASLVFSQQFSPTMLPVMMNVSAVLLTAFLLFIALFVAAYPFAIVNSGLCILFLVLKKKKDDENLLERKDKEEEIEEEAPAEPVEATKVPAPKKASRPKPKPKKAVKPRPSRRK
jgi:hypothetical protein